MSSKDMAGQPSRKRMREMFSPATLVRGGSLKSLSQPDVEDGELTPDQIIDEASMDSFPASDPPAWAAGPPNDPDEDES